MAVAADGRGQFSNDKMKFSYFLSGVILWAVMVLPALGEKFTINEAVTRRIKIVRASLSQDVAGIGDIYLIIYKKGKEIGIVEGKLAITADDENAPFFRDGKKFILTRGDGQCFVGFIEFEKSKTGFTDLRLATGKLTELEKGSGLFNGQPFDNIIYDQELIKNIASIL